MEKQICLILANHQHNLIATYLRRSQPFNQQYTIKNFSVSALVNQGTAILDEIVEQTTLFLYQPIKEELINDILSRLPANCHKISFPALKFTGYFPQYCQNPALKRIRPHHPSGVIPHGDTNIISLLEQNKTAAEIIACLSDRNFYTQDFLVANANQSLAELEEHESNLDIKVREFVGNHYQQHQLFYTPNHPTDMLGVYLVNQILEKLNFPPLLDPLSMKRSVRGILGKAQIPIYPSVIEHLGLTFAHESTVYGDSNFCTNSMTFARYITEYIDLHSTTSNSANQHYFKAIRLSKQRKYKLAIAALQQAIDIKPDNARYYQELGDILTQNNKLDEAEQVYKHAIKISPNWDNFYHLLGNVLIKKNNLTAAILAFKQAAILSPNCAKYYYALGDALVKLNKLNEAQKCFNKAIYLDPANASYYHGLGNVFAKADQLDLAKTSYKKAIFINPNRGNFYRSLACVLAQQEQLDEAISTCEQATKLNSKNPHFYRTLGDIQLQKGDVTHALKTYQRAIKLKPAQMQRIFAQLGDFIQDKVDETTHSDSSETVTATTDHHNSW